MISFIKKFVLFSFLSIVGLGVMGYFLEKENQEKVIEQNKVLKKELKVNKLSPPLAYDGDINLIEITNYVVVFDDSGSMGGTRLSDAKKALKFFLDKLKPSDRVSMIALNSGMFKGKEDILNSYLEIEADGGTPLGRSLKKAKQFLDALIKKNSGYGKYVIISISDGAATDVNDGELQDILKSIYETKEADIMLNTIGFHLGGSNNLNSPYTNYLSANSQAQLQNLFSQILAEEDSFGSDVNDFKEEVKSDKKGG